MGEVDALKVVDESSVVVTEEAIDVELVDWVRELEVADVIVVIVESPEELLVVVLTVVVVVVVVVGHCVVGEIPFKESLISSKYGIPQ